MPRSAPAQIFSRHWGPPRGCSVPGPCHGILFAFGFLAARESRSPSICGQPPGARGCRRASERECMVLQISQVSCTQGALRGGKTTTPPPQCACPRPCGDGALWEIWAAGASHAGGSSPGHSAAPVPVGLLGPPNHNMGPCSRPGEDPKAWKQFGPEPGSIARPIQRLYCPGNRASV